LQHRERTNGIASDRVNDPIGGQRYGIIIIEGYLWEPRVIQAMPSRPAWADVGLR
jgi:hypothetical protein